ncbi:MAG: TIM barrel protein [Verrucomicrobiae bacterium]|nr:TIM barrel protein [Verrucomicrobiae bacterium]
MNDFPNRRHFLKSSTALMAGGILSACAKQEEAGEETQATPAETRFKISLAEWSLHKALKAGEIENLEFPRIAKEMCGINAVEWVNQFFFVENKELGYQPKDQAYLNEMKKRTGDLGVTNVLIMCDHVGSLGDPDETRRSNAVKGHFAWLEAAKFLGCHSIRVNAASDRNLSPEQQRDLCVDGLSRLCEYAEPLGLGVIVENHGGLSSNGAWLTSVMKGVKFDNCGTLPDFGNFYVAKNRGNAEQYAKEKAFYENDSVYTENEGGLEYDRYQGVEDLMPFAKGVSAKAHDFNDQGEEVHTDFLRMMKIVADSGYKGHVGVEYEGSQIPEIDGIKKTKALLDKTFAALG